MLRARTGFTAAELVIVAAIVGILSALALPRLGNAAARAGVRSARQQVISSIAQARATAVRRGREARFVRTGSVVRVTVENGGVQTRAGVPQDLLLGQKVTVASTVDTIRFDPRGFAVGLAGMQVIRLTRGPVRDSVCVTRRGRVADGCAP